MFGLPQSTEVKRTLPKAQIFKKFGLKQSQRDAIDADIARMDFVNMISPQTLPAIAEGNEVKAIFVVEVELKRLDYDIKNISLIAKLIPQQIVFVLRYGDRVQLAVYFTKLFLSPWWTRHAASLPVNGLNLDIVWENIVRQISNVGTCLRHVSNPPDNIQTDEQSSASSPAQKHAESMSLREQIQLEEEHSKLMRQIESLERQMKATKQPRCKRELFLEIQKLRHHDGKTKYGK